MGYGDTILPLSGPEWQKAVVQALGYSLDAQSRAFIKFVADKEWWVYREYVEEGRSAHTDDVRKRPVFLQAIEDALAGKYDVLVVHKSTASLESSRSPWSTSTSSAGQV